MPNHPQVYFMKSKKYKSIIKNALKEDIQSGDLTSLSIFKDSDRCHAQLIAKQDGIIAGLAVFKETFKLLDEKIKVKLLFEDGQACKNKDVIAEKNHKYYQENKEVIKQNTQTYRENNKEIIREKKKEKFTCECGDTITKDHKARHKRSNKHQKYINNKETEEEVVIV